MVSYRPGSWLVGALRSLVDQADEVILVDNGSSEGAATELARSLGMAIEVIRAERNLGFAQAVNEGVSRCRGDLVALLNDDARAGVGWLSSAAEALRDGTVAAVSPKVVLAGVYRELRLPDPPWSAPGDSRLLGRQLHSVIVEGEEVLDRLMGGGVYPLESDTQGQRWRWSAPGLPFYVPVTSEASRVEVRLNGDSVALGPACRVINNAGTYIRTDGYAGDIGVGAPDDGRFDRRCERFALSGTALAFAARTWRRVGGFAPRYFAYYEDIDWCWRARLFGLRLLYDPSASVDHLRSATSGGPGIETVRVMAERNRTLTTVRNAPLARVARALSERATEGPDNGVRRGVARHLGWALATRGSQARRWRVRPETVWDHWAGRDTSWDLSPYNPNKPGPSRITDD